MALLPLSKPLILGGGTPESAMAQDPPSGVVCSAGVVDICCLFSLSNTITSYGDRYLP